MKCSWDYECTVIGGGPGGLVSSLYLCRFQRSVALVSNGKPRAAWIPKTHNLIGYYKGISGPLLLRRLRQQLSCFGLDEFDAQAKIHRLPSKGFLIDLGKMGTFKSKTVILATGIQDINPNLSNIDELRKLGLLRYCSICDGYEYRNKSVAVIAQNDFGIQKGLFIGQWTKDIRFLLREGQKLAPQRIQEIEKIHAKVHYCRTLEIKPHGTNRDRIQIVVNRREPIDARVAYVEMGCYVLDSAYRHLKKLTRTRDGFLVTTIEQRTSIPGLFAVGDCVYVLGQIAVAAGQAAVAATTIHNDLFCSDL